MSPKEHPTSESELAVLFIGPSRTAVEQAVATLDCDQVTVETVTDGYQAIQQLIKGSETATDTSLPDLILLEFGFEAPDGGTVLQAIKSSPRLGAVPVVVLTADGTDSETPYAHGGNAYLEIPDSEEGYTELLESVGRFWFEWVQYPSEYLLAQTV